jgi:hypothetical protein
MVETQEQLVLEWGESLRRASEQFTGGTPEEASFLGRGGINFVQLLSTIWEIMTIRGQRGGAPSKRLVHECNLILTMSAVPYDVFQRVDQFFKAAGVSHRDIVPTLDEIHDARQRLDAVVSMAKKLKTLAEAPPRVSTDLAELQRRTREADERGEWVPLKEAIKRMRQG